MASTYICDDYAAECCPDRPLAAGGAPHGNGWGERHCYHESTRRRLEWQYGENRVNAADVAAWNRLGQRREIAA